MSIQYQPSMSTYAPSRAPATGFQGTAAQTTAVAPAYGGVQASVGSGAAAQAPTGNIAEMMISLFSSMVQVMGSVLGGNTAQTPGQTPTPGTGLTGGVGAPVGDTSGGATTPGLTGGAGTPPGGTPVGATTTGLTGGVGAPVGGALGGAAMPGLTGGVGGAGTTAGLTGAAPLGATPGGAGTAGLADATPPASAGGIAEQVVSLFSSMVQMLGALLSGSNPVAPAPVPTTPVPGAAARTGGLSAYG